MKNLFTQTRSRTAITVYVLLLLMLSSYQEALAQPPLEYPIEVFRIRDANDNAWLTSETRRIDTDNFSGEAGWLYLQVNNLNRENAMEYRIRDYAQGDAGAWTEWQACQPNFDNFPKDIAYGGLGGGFGTVSFTTPISGLQPGGRHDIEFRFNLQEGDEASGYRIIDMALWAANRSGSPNLITNPRIETDPASWAGPYANRADRTQQAEAGERLWFSENILVNGSGTAIQASCSGCHATSDLKYFNYSDESIISRTNFHGLNREQGEQIAQYIRDLPAAASNNGRPWQPPYQPGPDADNNAYEWAAGQGLENVLDSDREMLADMYGSTNPSTEAIETAISGLNDNTNLRTQRLSVQFPDWKEWLPVDHPSDILSPAEYQLIKTAYDQLKSSVDDPGKVAALNAKDVGGFGGVYANNGLFEALGLFAREVNKVAGNNYNLTFPNSSIWAFTNSPQEERKKRSLAAWMSVKLFDVIQTYQLHDIDDLENIPDKDEEAFQWPIREWAVFQNAAHIIALVSNYSYFSTDRTDKQQTKSIYLSSIWYQMQMVLTPGHRKAGQVEPIDFAYNQEHIHRLGARSGIYEPARFFQNYQKTAEQRNSGKTPRESLSQSISGWNMRELSPWRLWSTGRGNTNVFDALPPDLRQRLREAYWNAALEVMEGFNDEDWPRTTVNECGRTFYHLENREAVPQNGATNAGNCVFYDRRCYDNCEDANDAVEIDAIYTLLYLIKDGSQVNEATFNRLRSWADGLWNYTDWPVYEGEPGGTIASMSSRIVVQAEDFTSRDPQSDPQGDAWNIYSNYQDYQGRGYVATPTNAEGLSRSPSFEQGAQLHYEFETDQAGTYHLWVRRFIRSAGTNSAFFGIDGVALDNVDNGEEVFYRWRWVKVASQALDQGPHSLQLARRENGYLVDAFLLTTSEEDPNESNARQTPVADKVVTLEETASELRFFPNPVKDGTLHISGTNAQFTYVVLFDVRGTPVVEQPVQNQQQVALNVSGLTPGVYVAKAYGPQKTSVSRVLIK